MKSVQIFMLILGVATVFSHANNLKSDFDDGDHAVVVNLTDEWVNFQGCPETWLGRIMGCSDHNTAPRKANFITKWHSRFFTNGTIAIKVDGYIRTYIHEKQWYDWDGYEFFYRGTVEDWRRANNLPTLQAVALIHNARATENRLQISKKIKDLKSSIMHLTK